MVPGHQGEGYYTLKITEVDSGYRAVLRAVHLTIFILTSSRRMLSLMGTATFGNKSLGLQQDHPKGLSEWSFPVQVYPSHLMPLTSHLLGSVFRFLIFASLEYIFQ